MRKFIAILLTILAGASYANGKIAAVSLEAHLAQPFKFEEINLTQPLANSVVFKLYPNNITTSNCIVTGSVIPRPQFNGVNIVLTHLVCFYKKDIVVKSVKGFASTTHGKTVLQPTKTGVLSGQKVSDYLPDNQHIWLNFTSDPFPKNVATHSNSQNVTDSIYHTPTIIDVQSYLNESFSHLSSKKLADICYGPTGRYQSRIMLAACLNVVKKMTSDSKEPPATHNSLENITVLNFINAASDAKAQANQTPPIFSEPSDNNSQ